MKKSIDFPDFPDIKDYTEIKNAALSGDLIIFIGAGISSVLGCLRWIELAENLVHYCRERNRISFWEEQQIFANGTLSRREGLANAFQGIAGKHALLEKHYPTKRMSRYDRCEVAG